MANTFAMLEPGIRMVFKEALENELGWNMPVNIQVVPSPLTDCLECRVSFKYEHKTYSKGINISRRLIEDDEYSLITRQVQALAKATARTLQKGESMATSGPVYEPLSGEMCYRKGTTFVRELDPLEAAVEAAVRELR